MLWVGISIGFTIATVAGLVLSLYAVDFVASVIRGLK